MLVPRQVQVYSICYRRASGTLREGERYADRKPRAALAEQEAPTGIEACQRMVNARGRVTPQRPGDAVALLPIAHRRSCSGPWRSLAPRTQESTVTLPIP